MGQNILTHFYPLFLLPSLLYLLNAATMIMVVSQNILITFDIWIHKWLATHQIHIFCDRKIIFPSLFLKFKIISFIVDIFDHKVIFTWGLCKPWSSVIPIISWNFLFQSLYNGWSTLSCLCVSSLWMQPHPLPFQLTYKQCMLLLLDVKWMSYHHWTMCVSVVLLCSI